VSDEALAALDLFLGWHHHQFPVFHDGARQPSRWHIAGRTDRLERSLHDGAGIAIGLPLGRREAGGPTGATIAWARIAGASQYSRALKFKPLPTMVLQEGRSTRRLLIWALDTFLAYDLIFDANRRIAYRLEAVQKHGDPDSLRIALPGTLVDGKRRVTVARLTTDTHSLATVVGQLRQPPDNTGWRKAA
jgi:hypothetical protein